MTRLVLSLFLSFVATTVFAQTFTLSGQVVGEKSTPLVGANILLSTRTDSIFKATVTDAAGKFIFTDLETGFYQVKISYIGYQTVYQRRFIRDSNLELGAISVAPSTVGLNEVEVVEQTLQAVQKEDTTEFNANAFKVNVDANADDLIKKMPGVTESNGKLQAQGEDVKQVLVDGRPFFGNDPNAALKTLPAEVIDKIQIFDRESEQAQLTGISDGETSKVINIITKTNMRNGEFGKVYAGYGYENRYQAGGNANIFSGNRRLSFIGQTNNVNQQNFANEDLLNVLGSTGRGRRGGGGGRGGDSGGGGGISNDFVVGAQNGISTTHAFGVNYSDKWGEKIEASGSYFFNLSDNDALQNLARTFLNARSDFEQRYVETDSSFSKNINHRLNFRLEYKIDEYKTLTLTPRLSLQQNSGSQMIFGQNQLGSQFLNQTDYDFFSDLNAIDANLNLAYRQRFEKKGRSFSATLTAGYNDNAGDSELRSFNNSFVNPLLSDTLDQNADLLTNGWSASARLMYTEPLSEKTNLYTDYNASWQRTNANQHTFDWDETTQQHTNLNPTLSNDFKSDYLTQRIGGGVRYGDRNKFNAGAGLGLQWSQLNNQLIYPNQGTLQRTFYNLIPFAMARFNLSKTENLRFFYRVNTNPPTIAQLQNVVNNNDPMQLRIGNPDLDQQVRHNLSLRYNQTNTEKSTVFYAMLSADFRENYVANSTFIARQDTVLPDGLFLARGGQLTQPVNLDGYQQYRLFVTYGFPLKALKSNLNLNFSSNYTRQPGLVNEVKNVSDNRNVGIGIALSSNISEKVDFNISSTSNLNDVVNSANDFANTQFFNQTTTAMANLVFGKNWVFRTEVSHQFYSGLSDGFNQNFFLWNLSFGKKFLKDNRGDLRLIVFDVLGQNTSISRTVTEAAIEDVQTQVLQRYVMLNFTYTFRSFGKMPAETPRERPWGW